MRKGESIEEYEQVIEVDDIIKAPIKKVVFLERFKH